VKKCIFLILFILFASTTLFSQSIVDSFEARLINSKEGERVEILSRLVFEYRDSNPPKAVEYGEEALGLLGDFKEERMKGAVFNNLAWAYYNLSEFQIALDHANSSLEIAQEINDLRLKSATLNNIGAIYYKQNDFVKALEQYLLALEIQEELQDSFNIASSYNNIGLIFFSTKDYNKSLEYLSKALEIYEELNANINIAYTTLNIAGTYSNLDNSEKALDYCLSSLKYSEEIGNERLSGIILTNIAIMYYDDFDNKNEALEYFNKALIIAQKYNDKRNTAISLHNIGSIHKDLGLYEVAMKEEREALKFAQEINDYSQIAEIIGEISSIYAKMNNFQNAYEYHVKFKALNDSIFNIESDEKITEMETKYETEKKEQQIVLLEKDKTISGMKLKRQRSLLLYLTGGIVMIFLFVLILSNLYRQKVKTSAALAVANGKLEELSRTDPLTKLWNRRYLHEIIELERTRIKRAFEPFSFILMDIDHFKNVNDTHGHECGDYVLATMAVILRSAVRKQDLVGRWGGEEFLLFLPKTSLKGAITIAESVRKKIEDYPFTYSSKKIPVTATFGVSQYDESLSVDECIKLSDDALYEGKESGRNRVVTVQEVG